MNGTPFHIGGHIDLSEGESIKDFTAFVFPKDKLAIIEFVGLNAFVQPGQTLFVALEVQTDSGLGNYPIHLPGAGPFVDPTYPFRLFGSQQVLLYADPESKLILNVARFDAKKEARILFDISGRLEVPGPVPPTNLHVIPSP